MEGLDGITPFCTDDKFPLITINYRKETLPRWFADNEEYFSNKIAYLNNRGFFKEPINLPSKLKDYPLSLVDSIDDYLSNSIDKLHVMYADCLHDYSEVIQSEYYELIEAFTKYHLRGKTVSKSLSFESIDMLIESNGLGKIVITNSCDHEKVFKTSISKDFPGY